MPKSLREILDTADELADRFERFDPRTADEISVAEYHLHRAAMARAAAERSLLDAVAAAREVGVPWARIGELLVRDGVVARCAGRMEFGARALGNRSILANPADRRVVDVINAMIKNRDFWMPFAPSVLQERQADYLVNPRGLRSPYMMLAFPTVPARRDEIAAAVHPRDFTARAHIVEAALNPEYHAVIREFERIEGGHAIGARHGRAPERGQRVAHQERDALAEPERPRIVAHRPERHHEDRRRHRRGLGYHRIGDDAADDDQSCQQRHAGRRRPDHGRPSRASKPTTQ